MHLEKRGIVFNWKTDEYGCTSRRVIFWSEAIFSGAVLAFGVFLLMGN